MLGALLTVFMPAGFVSGEDYLLAEAAAWPGKVWMSRNGELSLLHERPTPLADDLVPRVQSLTRLPSGEIAFCSGLDRTVLGLNRGSERRLHHGGGLVRQVRMDREGRVYWSGLETPLENNPLPDGFIYRLDPASGEAETLMTFSQQDVGSDWWGAFDVHQGKIYVGTLRDQTSIYDVSVSPVKRVCQLPFAATAFRLRAGGLYACDGKGHLFHVPDLSRPDEYSPVLDLTLQFVDFEPLPTAE